MAVLNEILVGRFNRMLQKLLSMKGPASMNSLSPELSATIVFLSGRENRYLEGWDLFAATTLQNGAVGTAASVRLRNPSNSNVIAVVEKATVGATLADQPFLEQGSLVIADYAGGIAVQRLDPRTKRTSSTLVPSGATTRVGLDNAIERGIITSTTGSYEFVQFENQELPLLPGDAIQISATVVNQPIFVTYLWRERFLEESERT